MMNSNFRPSPEVAKELRKKAVYGKPEPVGDHIVRILADNAKDYTGPGTNTYIVGDRDVWIIDPGPNRDCHIDAVLQCVNGRHVKGILVTHTHLDHSPAAAPLKAETGGKTYGFGPLDKDLIQATDEDVDCAFEPDVCLSDGALLGTGDFVLQATHTPGHFPNHLCYVLLAQKVIFSGDHVMDWATTVVVPPLGNLAEYLDSLTLLGTKDAQKLLPSHGPVVENPRDRIAELYQHRLMRHRQILSCLQRGIRSPAAIVEEIYEGLTPRLLVAARGCVEAHLELETEIAALKQHRSKTAESLTPLRLQL